MINELNKYKSNGHFFFDATNELEMVCNAPKNGIGVYLIFELKRGKINLVYIGSSGKIEQEGNIKIRKGGIYDRLVNGKQFGDSRKKSWKQKLITENIEALDIYWFKTFDKDYSDIPTVVEGNTIQLFYDIHGHLPKWNKSF